jgi:hypothetical protein
MRTLGHSGHTAAIVAAVATAAVALAPPALASPGGVRGARLARGSGLSLSRAPAGLRTAVRRTFRAQNGSTSSAFQQGELTASDGAANDLGGFSVAIYGQRRWWARLATTPGWGRPTCS